MLLFFSLSVFFSVMFGTWFLRSTRVEGYVNVQASSNPTIHVVNQTSPANTTGDYYYSSIQAAVDNASDGDTVIVCPGTYYESVDVFTKSLTIRSSSGNPADTIVNASGKDRGFEVDGEYIHDYINITGFTVTGTPSPHSGVLLYRTSYANISNNIIYGNYQGIKTKRSNYNLIENNNVSANDYWGIFLYNSSYTTIRCNNVSNNVYGIYLDDEEASCLGNTISYNNIFNNTKDPGDYDLYNLQSNVATAEYNWWGTTNYSVIEGNIWDDDEGPYGKVDFIPLLDGTYPIGQPLSKLVVNQTSPACTTGVCFSTIQDAVDAANSGDEIVVCPGTYDESVTIQSKSLDISSYSGNTSDTIVDVPSGQTGFAIYGTGAENTTISGFKILGGSSASYGVTIEEIDYVEISNNYITENEYGIIITSDYATIENNNITLSNDTGILLDTSNNNTIGYNNINNNTLNGIYLYDSTNNTISYNNILDNNYNLYNGQSNDVAAEYNWWGTTNSTTIDNNINDDPTYGEVNFIPFLNAPYPTGQSRSPWSKSTCILNSSSIHVGSSVEISSLIRDNLTSIPIGDYYTEIYANNTMISNGTSNTNGWYNYTWSPSTVGNYTIKSAIYNDTNKNYIAVYNDTKILTVKELGCVTITVFFSDACPVQGAWVKAINTSNEATFYFGYTNESGQVKGCSDWWTEGALYRVEAYYPDPGTRFGGDSYFVYENGTGSTTITGTYEITPPVVVILSPQNMTYTNSSVSLNFTIDDYSDISWTGYGLDNQANVTITGNTTLSGLIFGSHNIIVYSNDTYGNTGSSDKVYFTITEPTPVGGIYIPANKLELLAPYIGLAILLAVAVVTVVFFKHKKDKS